MARRIQKKRRGVQLRRAFRILYGVILVLSAVIVTTYAAYHILVKPPSHVAPPMSTVPVSPPSDNPDTPEDERLTTPTPPERKPGYYTFLLAATDVGGGNSDTIMVASYDTVNQKVSMVSIPRDTMTKKYAKINAVYAKGGIDELRAVVSDLIGIPIDYTVSVSIRGFKSLINAVDGVDFYIPCDMNYDDSTPGEELYIHYSEGMKHLNGQQALEVVRFRHNNDGSGYTDTGRAKTQQKLLTAVAKKLISWSSLTKVNQFVDIFSKNVKTNLTAGDYAFFVPTALGVDLKNNVSTATLPGDGNVTYKRTSWCYQLYPQECLDIFNQYLNPYTTEMTMEMTNIFQAK